MDRSLLKKKGVYMLDSSYLVASNPNSMRDQGPCRNAEYDFTPSIDADGLSGLGNTAYSYTSWQSPQQARKQYIKGRGNKSVQGVLDYKNKGVYSYGGKTKIGGRLHHKKANSGFDDLNQNYLDTMNKWSQSIDSASPTIERDYNQRVNDYSKNVSQTIFNPGLVSSSTARLTKTPGKYNPRKIGGRRRSIGQRNNGPQDMKQYRPLRTNAIATKLNGQGRSFKPQSAGRSFRSAKSLSRMLDREKRYDFYTLVFSVL